MSEEPPFRCRDLRWEVDGRAIVGPLDLELVAGECLILIGPNGAGKTSLLRLLTGLLEPSGGERFLAGRKYEAWSRLELARQIAYVPQIRPARVPLSVEDVVLQGRYPHRLRDRGRSAAKDFAAVERALATVGIDSLRHRRLDRLSGGERQAAYIAAALAQETPILVLDEPTTHLDPRHQRRITELLLALRLRGEHTVVAATHDLALASRVADRVCALRDGRVLGLGSPAEMMRPEVLEDLFDTPFELLRGGDRPLPHVALEGRPEEGR